MNTNSTTPPAAPETQESYIVSEGKKRGSTRDVRPEAAFDRYYTVERGFRPYIACGPTLLHAMYGRKPRSTAITRSCACTRVTQFSRITGTPMKCGTISATTSKDTRSQCARWRLGGQ